MCPPGPVAIRDNTLERPPNIVLALAQVNSEKAPPSYPLHISSAPRPSTPPQPGTHGASRVEGRPHGLGPI